MELSSWLTSTENFSSDFFMRTKSYHFSLNVDGFGDSFNKL